MSNRRTNKTTPIMRGGYLEYPEVTPIGPFVGKVKIDTPEWTAWLDRPETTVFSYEGEFTVQRRKRGDLYWIASKKIGGKNKKQYLGLAEKITADRLRKISEYFKLAPLTVTDWRSKYSAFPVGKPDLLDIVESNYAVLHGQEGRYKGCVIEKQGREYYARRNGETIAYFQSWDRLIDHVVDYVASGKANQAMLRQK